MQVGKAEIVILSLYLVRCMLSKLRVVTLIGVSAVSKQWSLLMAGDDNEMFMTRSLDVMPKTTEQHLIACSDKSVAYVTNNKRLCSTFCTVEANYWQTRSIVRPLCDSRATCYANNHKAHQGVQTVQRTGTHWHPESLKKQFCRSTDGRSLSVSWARLSSLPQTPELALQPATNMIPRRDETCTDFITCMHLLHWQWQGDINKDYQS